MGKNGAKRDKHANGNSALHFSSVARSTVPHSRKGKHNEIVAEVLGDLDKITARDALKIPRKGLDASIQKVRSALSRESRKRGFAVATASDESFLYVWRKDSPAR